MSMQLQRRTGGVILTMLLCGVSPLVAQPQLAISAEPRFTFQPGNAWVTVVIERDSDNRSLTLEADGPDYYTASTRDLNGASSPRTQRIAFKALPAGSYVITATLVRANGTRERAVATVDVLESAAAMHPDTTRPATRNVRPGRQGR